MVSEESGVGGQAGREVERGGRASEWRRKWEQCGANGNSGAVTLVDARGFCSLHKQTAGWTKRAHEGGRHKPA
jgi:hypothetical protein